MSGKIRAFVQVQPLNLVQTRLIYRIVYRLQNILHVLCFPTCVNVNSYMFYIHVYVCIHVQCAFLKMSYAYLFVCFMMFYSTSFVNPVQNSQKLIVLKCFALTVFWTCWLSEQFGSSEVVEGPGGSEEVREAGRIQSLQDLSPTSQCQIMTKWAKEFTGIHFMKLKVWTWTEFMGFYVAAMSLNMYRYIYAHVHAWT